MCDVNAIKQNALWHLIPLLLAVLSNRRSRSQIQPSKGFQFDPLWGGGALEIFTAFHTDKDLRFLKFLFIYYSRKNDLHYKCVVKCVYTDRKEIFTEFDTLGLEHL